jgi:hypothetical protein
MPEIKRAFNAGRMNKDLDERLVPQGEYIEANNIQIVAPEEGAIGVIKNIKGNEVVSEIDIAGAEVVGSVVDTAANKIYWFIHGSEIDAIAVYDGTSVSPVLVDTTGVLGFTGNKIYSINIIESTYLAWTDNNSEPKIIDIALFASGSTNFAEHTQINSANFVERDITVIKEKPSNAPVIYFDTTETSEDKPYETKFVRFAYRWKFTNGQYSVFSPFSKTAFYPGLYRFNAKEGYNTGMENTAYTIQVSNILAPHADIESVDLIIKASDDNTIYIVETLPVASIISGYTYALTSEQIYSIISSDQLLRLWDAVPLKAKAQEFIGNRVIYGHYELGENTQAISPEFNISIVNREAPFREHIKTNRAYQFGIVFEDYYGRQTPVITNKSGSINIPFGDATYLSNPKKFQIQMTDTLPTNNFARFKYFIKDISGEYYNVVVESIFPNPEKIDKPEVWLALPSTEINKFREGQFLLLKKGQQSGTPIANPDAKFKVIATQGTAPDFIGTDYSANTAVTSVTNFDYLDYSTAGRFFVRLEDKDNILRSLFVANIAPAVEEEILEVAFETISYPSGIYLGRYLIYDGGGSYHATTHYFKYDSVNANGEVGYIVSNPQIGTGISVGYPEGTLVTTDITSGSIKVDGTNASVKWYYIGPYNGYPDGVPRDIYVQWSSNLLDVDKVVVFPEESEAEVIDPAVFETESEEQYIDIYYETEESWDIADYGDTQALSYFNCINFQNGVESNRIRDDFNAPTIDKQVRVSTTLPTPYKRSVNKSGLIWSGLFNARNNVNNLNQFSVAEPITKDLSPEYGSIQRIFTRNTDLISFCEDKVIRILANKDALYNADGSTNITASNAVLGQAVAYAGEFGISTNPESLADYGYRTYFTDKERGVILRLSADGLEVISDDGMSSWFRNKFRSHTGDINGAYDIYSNQYIVSFEGDRSVSYSEYTKGWTSFHEYTFKDGISLNGDFYTFADGILIDDDFQPVNGANPWKHYSNDVYSNIYGTAFVANVKFVFNEEASVVKNFKTMTYEGSSGWEVDSITTDMQTGQILSFVGKEGKYFDYISGKADLDLSNFSVQGLGIVQSNVIVD